MPNINDPERARLIKTMAKRESLAAAQAILEKAVELKDREKIRTATTMLQDILTERSTTDLRKNRDIALDLDEAWRQGYAGVSVPLDRFGRPKTRDAFYSPKRSESLRPTPCKPEDCATCFWRTWCEMKESFDLYEEIDRILKKGKESVRTWNQWHKPVTKSRVEADKGEVEARVYLRLPPKELEQKIEDWHIIRKEAKDILRKAKRNN